MSTQLTAINTFKGCCLALLLTALAAALAMAQSTGGRISGTITDQAGAVIANAKITVTSEGRGAQRNATSDQNGFYAAPELPVGFYTITVEGTGFAPATRTRVKVDVAAETRLDVSLVVQATKATVDVRAEAPLLQPSSSTLSDVIND